MSFTLKGTPPRPASYSCVPSSQAIAQEVMLAVKKDLNKAIALTSAELFMQTILGIKNEESLPLSLEAIIKEHYDGKRGRWSEFPTDEEVEGSFYEPFVRLANKIADGTVRAFPNDAHTIRGEWIDCHSISPEKSTVSIADIRPDCAFVTNAGVALTLEKDIAADKDEVNKREKIRKTWWSQIVVAVEIKRPKKGDKSDQNVQYLGALPQLSGYIRQVFRQQLDRRFALGITISFNNIAVWLFDRSGVLGMSQVRNIHKDPRMFVRIISAISRLPGNRLGYDPSMRLYDASLGEFKFSHEIKWTHTNIPPQITESKWCLRVTDNRESNDPKECVVKEVILDGPPLLARSAEVMNGRAVQVYQGYLKEDSERSYRTPLVIKTSWQPTSKIIKDDNYTISFEANFYNAIPGFKDRVVAASVVMTSDGWDDTHGSLDRATRISTLEYARQNAGVDMEAGKRLNGMILAKESRPEDLDERAEPLAFLAFGGAAKDANQSLLFVDGDDSKLADRILTRIVLNNWGFPLKFFTCKGKFLEHICDIIKDHLAMVEAGVLHRDLSDGNIILQPKAPTNTMDIRDLVSQTKGTLIDLDHAKMTSVTKTVGKLPPLDAVRRGIQVARFLDIPITEGAFLQALKFFPGVIESSAYFQKASEYNVMQSKSDGGDWTAEDLGWDDVGKQWDFDAHVPDANAERTGTIPFISHRLMNLAQKPDSHNAIHDMESLFWIIIYICLVRVSGGGYREKNPPDEPVKPAQPNRSGPPAPETSEEREKREEREKAQREKTKRRKTYIFDLFFSHKDTIGSHKAKQFDSNSDEIIRDLLDHIHDYFSPFKEMLLRWRNLLVLGYTYKAYEYYHVHRYLLKIVEDTMRHPDVLGEAQDTAIIREEIDRRVKEYKFICNIPDSQGDTDTGAPYSTRSAPHSTAASPAQAARVGHVPAPTFAATHPHTSLATPGTTSNPLSAFPSSAPTNCPSNVSPSAASSSLNPTTASSATNRPIYHNTATPVSTPHRSPASVPSNQSSNVARGSLIATPTQASNRSYPSVPTSSPIPNRPPTSFASHDASSSRASSNVVPTVPTTPTSSRTSSSRASAVPGQNETSPKMPVPKKSRKE